MKNKFSFLLLFLITHSTFATHNMCGDISYTHISGFTYKITIRTYTNTLNTSADRCELSVNTGDGDSLIVHRVNGASTFCTSPNHDGVMLGSCTNTKENIYEGTHTFPGTGTYIILIEDPNRNAGICNIPNSINTLFSLQAELIINPFLGDNNGVQYTNIPFIKDSLGVISYYNPSVYDVDGDSLYYLLTPAIGGSSYSLPSSTHSFMIDSLTGAVVWDAPNVMCNYVFDIKISEWRNVGGARYFIGSTMQEIHTGLPCNSHLSINEIQTNASLSISPNPATNSIQVSNLSLQIKSVCIYSSLGQCVLKHNEINKTNFKMDISSLRSGIYFVQVQSQEGVLNKKIMVQ